MAALALYNSALWLCLPESSTKGVQVAMPHVNLDALIRRETFDVEVEGRPSVDEGGTLKIIELEKDSLMFKWLRKPDFQRRTSHWTPAKVASFIESFLTGDLIPALIFWQSQSSGRVFVIDGAHRLSALLAWVHDDYGDGSTSLPFFEGRIPPEQRKAANETRKLVAQRIGTYAEIKHSQNLSPQRSEYSSRVAASGVTLQWVKGDASRAARSFHTINTEQTPIGDLEVRLIRDRNCPNAIATRALIAAGTGEHSRSSFSEENKTQIRQIAQAVYDDLFVPPLDEPIKTLELPVAGRSYSSESVRMILDLVEFLNKQPPKQASEHEKPRRAAKPHILTPTMAEDGNGEATVRFLKNVRRASSLIAGTRASSLGLSPAVYFYSATGAFQPAAFLSTISFVQGLESRNKLIEFTKHRRAFEELLLECKPFMNFIVQRYGSGQRSHSALLRFFQYVFEAAVERKPKDEFLPVLLADDRLAFLEEKIDKKGTRQEFTTERKSAVFLRDAIKKALPCSICGAATHSRSITIDHNQKIESGGLGGVDNGRVSHPFCNASRDSLEVDA